MLTVISLNPDSLAINSPGRSTIPLDIMRCHSSMFALGLLRVHRGWGSFTFRQSAQSSLLLVIKEGPHETSSLYPLKSGEIIGAQSTPKQPSPLRLIVLGWVRVAPLFNVPFSPSFLYFCPFSFAPLVSTRGEGPPGWPTLPSKNGPPGLCLSQQSPRRELGWCSRRGSGQPCHSPEVPR